MTDLQLPKPLLSPSLWPSQWPQGPALVSIDILRYGGPLANLAQRAQAFAVPADFWDCQPGFAAVLEEAPLESLDIVSQKSLSHTEAQTWRKHSPVPVHFHVDSNLNLPSLYDWSLEVFPESAREAGELHWTRLMKEYEKELGGKGAGLDALRFWPSYLRRQKVFFAEVTAREWAHAQALFSPQDDSRGTGAHVMQNPTLQIVTGDQTLTAFWRTDGTTVERRDLTWEEAAVIDELRETPRLPLEVLRHELHQKKFPLKNHSTFHLVIESLIQQGVLLLRP